ncbi:SH3 domain-containing C40 family peptidase [Exiguobacterium sp. MMG028]|uniref:C40 family peptidase n=1 Tax=Exiguobacterium sp. MMG028 TaxID=3021979 RepID=UPI0022FDC62E|nr:SH3 domain-containing C40 family peptidase [Exiguobacterium sp. MMG028]MDA5560934.1 SH3 domain-containing C40 family peptidase [Exiguobacterium sp. MMG028]
MLKRIASIVVAATVAFSGLMFSTGEQAEAATGTFAYSKVNGLNIRTAPSLTSSKVVAKMDKGQRYTYLGKSGSFYKINYKGTHRYISASSTYTYLKPRTSTSTTTTVSTSSSSKRAKLVAESKKYLGTPYRYGGTTTAGFDCSGYTGHVYKKAIGKTLPRSSRQQYSSAKKISKSSIQAGDLVFFSHSGGTIHHVGMALSKTQMINSETGGVKYASFTSGYWAPRYVGAGSYL